MAPVSLLVPFTDISAQYMVLAQRSIERVSVFVVLQRGSSSLQDAYEQVRRDILECKVKVRNVEVDTANILDEEIVSDINKTVVRLFVFAVASVSMKSAHRKNPTM
jgi:hypothetical protein